MFLPRNIKPPRRRVPNCNPEGDIMRIRNSLSLAVLALLLAAPLLGACHTTAGAGEDIQATGHTIDKAATNATP